MRKEIPADIIEKYNLVETDITFGVSFLTDAPVYVYDENKKIYFVRADSKGEEIGDETVNVLFIKGGFSEYFSYKDLRERVQLDLTESVVRR